MQLNKVLEIYWELQVRHAHLAHSTVQAAVSSAQHQLNTVTKDGRREGGANGEVGGVNGAMGGVLENGEMKGNGGNSTKGGGELFSNFLTNLMVVLKEGEGEKEEGTHLFNMAVIR